MKSINCKDILTKCNYLVKIYQNLNQNGCKVCFPKIYMFSKDKIETWETEFILEENLIRYQLLLNDKITTANINVPNYAQRMFVDIDITKSCSLIKYSTEHIDFIDKIGNNKDSLLDIIFTSDLEKEVEFCDIFNKAVQDSFKESYYNTAKQKGLAEGFLVCARLIGGMS